MGHLYNLRILQNVTLPNLFCEIVILLLGAGLSSGLAESCEMIVEMCSSLYKRKLYDGGGDYSDERVCSVLQSFESCLRGSAKSCSGKISYDTLTTIISRILLHLCFELVLWKCQINNYVTRKTCVKSHAKQEVYNFVVETLNGLVAAMITNSQQKPITRDRPLLHLHQCIFVCKRDCNLCTANLLTWW